MATAAGFLMIAIFGAAAYMSLDGADENLRITRIIGVAGVLVGVALCAAGAVIS